jgi:hypothetical protein
MQEREHFYSRELAYFSRDAPVNILLGGDFNFLLYPSDTTWHYTYSRALAGLVQGFEMQDVWQQHPAGLVYFPHSPN